MGRPFDEEIAELEDTHRWACEAPIESLVEHVLELSSLTLLSVGSGGSLTTATMAVNLCRDFTSNLSFAFTPQELWSRRTMLRHATVFIATAGGSTLLICLAIQTFQSRTRSWSLCASVSTQLRKNCPATSQEVLKKSVRVLDNIFICPADLKQSIQNLPPHPPLHPPFNFHHQRSKQLLVD